MPYRGMENEKQSCGWENRRILPSGSDVDIGGTGLCGGERRYGRKHCNSGDAVTEKQVESVREDVAESERT